MPGAKPKPKGRGSQPGQVRNPRGKIPGTKNRRTLMLEAIKAGTFKPGITPLEFFQQMLENKKNEYGTYHQIVAAKEMLPYLHRKMPVAVEVIGDDEPPPVAITIDFKDARKPK